MNNELNGKVSKRILEIEKSGKFHKGYTLPGCHEFVAHLNDYERAICTYMEEIFISGADREAIKFQVEILKGELWFSIIDRLNLWANPKSYAINNGSSLVIPDDDAVKEILGAHNMEVNSIDDLPGELRKALTDLVLSSKTFGFRGDPHIN
jgi:hypothetical protein